MMSFVGAGPYLYGVNTANGSGGIGTLRNVWVNSTGGGNPTASAGNLNDISLLY